MKIHGMSLIPAVSILVVVSVDARPQAPGRSPYQVVTGKAYKFEKITDGVYYATATGSMITGSNNVAIIGDRDVLVVDTGTSPAGRRDPRRSPTLSMDGRKGKEVEVQP